MHDVEGGMTGGANCPLIGALAHDQVSGDCAAPNATHVTLVAGRVEGVVRQFWPNGNRQLLAAFVDGQPHGEMRVFNEDGVMTMRASYQSGLLHGPCLQLVHGQTVSILTYQQGKLHGNALCFDQVSARAVALFHYENGLLHGWTRYWRPDGSLVRDEKWHAGVLQFVEER